MYSSYLTLTTRPLGHKQTNYTADKTRVWMTLQMLKAMQERKPLLAGYIYLWSPPIVSEIFPCFVAFATSSESYKQEDITLNNQLHIFRWDTLAWFK